MEQYVGQTLGRYSLSSLLGEGSMGAVFKAQDTTLKRQVAVKIMRPDMAVQPDFRDRFLQEARTEAQLTHPNIVQVYDFGQEGDTLYIVMEFLNGKNLEEHFNELRTKGEWLDLVQTLEITRQLALALHYAHRQGILHRDIKPVNVFLTPVEGDKIPYRPILTDVGLAKLATGGVVTMVGVSLGTPAYMSPETALGKDTEPRSDLYSLGVLLFQMATQQLPFPANNLFDAMKYHGKEPPPSPRSISKDIPESLDKCILKLLEKDPQNRPADASSLAKELESILEEIQKPVLPARPEVDMSTRIQVDGLDERDQSILTEFSKAKEPPRDCIKIHSGGEVIKMHTIKTDKIVIGRALETDIVLNDAKVSREHARIEFDGSNYRVIDQGSTNGTFMGDARLLPGVPEPWTPDKVLHIGDFYLHLERSEVILPAKPPVDATYISSAEPHQEPVQSRPAGQGSIDITMEKSLLTVEPGQTIQLIVTLANQGSLVEHLKTSVDGIPANWIPTPPPTIQLMPGDQQEMSIAVQPPRSPKGRAGDYPIKVQVTTRDGRDHAEVDGVLKVLSFSQFTSELHPQKIRAGKAGRVRIQNKGNAPETYNLNWQDRAVELDFQPPQARIQVQEGQADTAEFRAAPRQRRLLGGQQTHPITVQVAASSGTPQTLTGEVISKALIPPWIIPVVLVLCVLLAAAAALLTPPLIIHPRETQAAIAASETAAAGTQIALSDPDSDGLNNAEEANIGTNPENSDTDDDGLKDGAEVKQHGTDPKNKDSDQDTLLDGAEVSGGCTSPKNPDSDGDSLPDNVDSNPCMLPTETPKPTLTPTPTQTPTPTTTPTPTPQPYIACPGLYQSRIHVGDFAFVSEDPPTANRVRKDHDTSAEILGFIQPGEKVEILEGPFCGEWIWWKVRSMESGLVGWTAEGDSKNYWLVPMSK